MQFMLMSYVNEGGWSRLSKVQQEQGVAAYKAYVDALNSSRVLVSSVRIKGSAAATTVHIASGATQVRQGPYANSQEQLGGNFIIDVDNLDAAVSWAARCPAAGHGAVEVRPLWDAST